MNRAEAIKIIKRGLGFRQTQDEAIIAALQSAQRTLEKGKTLPDWLITYNAAIVVPAGDLAFFPSDFLRMTDEYELYYINNDAAQVFLPRKNYTEAYTAFVANGDADDSVVISAPNTYPQVVVVRGNTGLLLPTPTVDLTVYLTYYAKAEVLSSDLENAWLLNAPDYLIGEAGIMVAGNLRDKDALTAFTTMRNRGAQSYLGEIIETELAGRPMVMGRNN